jgi:hypothetical protein
MSVEHLVHEAVFWPLPVSAFLRREGKFPIAPAIRRINTVGRIVGVHQDELLLVALIGHEVVSRAVLIGLRQLGLGGGSQASISPAVMTGAATAPDLEGCFRGSILALPTALERKSFGSGKFGCNGNHCLSGRAGGQNQDACKKARQASAGTTQRAASVVQDGGGGDGFERLLFH